ELATLRSAVNNALGPSGASISPVKRQDGNVFTVFPHDAGPFFCTDMRTLSAHMPYPFGLSMHSGFGLILYENGRLRVFGGHVVRNGNGPHELVWTANRVVWPDSAEMEHAFREVISGLNEHLRSAVEHLVGFLG